jgi:hypothetical protein
VAVIPAGAQRSPDGHYWWDENAQDWLPTAGSSSEPAAAAAPAGPPARTGSISIELGVIAEETHSHDDVVAMVERGGASLPEGEAYA